jgi:hypothetical protein
MNRNGAHQLGIPFHIDVFLTNPTATWPEAIQIALDVFVGAE